MKISELESKILLILSFLDHSPHYRNSTVALLNLMDMNSALNDTQLPMFFAIMEHITTLKKSIELNLSERQKEISDHYMAPICALLTVINTREEEAQETPSRIFATHLNSLNIIAKNSEELSIRYRDFKYAYWNTTRVLAKNIKIDQSRLDFFHETLNFQPSPPTQSSTNKILQLLGLSQSQDQSTTKEAALQMNNLLKDLEDEGIKSPIIPPGMF